METIPFVGAFEETDDFVSKLNSNIQSIDIITDQQHSSIQTEYTERDLSDTSTKEKEILERHIRILDAFIVKHNKENAELDSNYVCQFNSVQDTDMVTLKSKPVFIVDQNSKEIA